MANSDYRTNEYFDNKIKTFVARVLHDVWSSLTTPVKDAYTGTKVLIIKCWDDVDNFLGLLIRLIGIFAVFAPAFYAVSCVNEVGYRHCVTTPYENKIEASEGDGKERKTTTQYETRYMINGVRKFDGIGRNRNVDIPLVKDIKTIDEAIEVGKKIKCEIKG